MTAGRDLDRVERLRLVRAAEARYGLRTKTRAVAAWDVSADGLLDAGPAWFDAPSTTPGEGARRAGRVGRSGRGNSAVLALLESFARAYCEPPMYVFRGPYLDVESSERLDHPLTRRGGLLRAPNDGAGLTMAALRSAIAKARLVAGNF